MDPIAPVILSIALILVAAKLGGHVAVRFNQPPVLGELAAGVLIGNLAFVGVPGFEYLKTDGNIDMLARLGVVLLLFQVGLESTVGQMAKVGLSSFIVATLGVIGPFVLPGNNYHVYDYALFWTAIRNDGERRIKAWKR